MLNCVYYKLYVRFGWILAIPSLFFSSECVVCVCGVVFVVVFMGGYVSKTVPDKRRGISFKTIFFYITRKAISKRLCFMHLPLTHINRKHSKI